MRVDGSQFDRVTSITFSPTNQNEIYLTTETQGLNICLNINSVTPTFSLVNSYPFRQPERVFFNPYNANQMWVSSFGNGMKMGDFTTGVGPVSDRNSELNIYPNPAANQFTIYNLQYAIERLKLFDVEEKEIRNLEFETGKHEVSINVAELISGIYFVRVETEERVVMKKVAIVK